MTQSNKCVQETSNIYIYNFQPNFQKRGLDRTSIFRAGLPKKGELGKKEERGAGGVGGGGGVDSPIHTIIHMYVYIIDMIYICIYIIYIISIIY